MTDDQIISKMLESDSIKDLCRKCHMPKSFLMRRFRQADFKDSLKKTRLLLINQATDNLSNSFTKTLTILGNSVSGLNENEADKTTAALQDCADRYKATIDLILKIQKAESQKVL